MRFRYNRGHSWRGSQPGTRHWESGSVYFGFGDLFWYGIGWLLWWFVAVPFFLFPLWMAIEVYILLGTGLYVLYVWSARPETRGNAEFHRHGVWWWLAVKEAGDDDR